MGVVHVLMAALMSIAYGWESDGNGGVEYIVQVSPDELKEINRLGEISSTIDPRIAGHVSRISIRVGAGSLPRETPTHLLPRAGVAAYDQMTSSLDSVAIPIPELSENEQIGRAGRAVPIPALDQPDVHRGRNLVARSETATLQAGTAAMMKPDPDNAGPGFSFPSIGNTANDPRLNTQNNIDQAGREIVASGQNMVDNLRENAGNTIRNAQNDAANNFRVPPPGTRPPPTVPPFTDPRSTIPPFSGSTTTPFPGTTTPPFPGTTTPQFPGTTTPQFPGSTTPQFPGSTTDNRTLNNRTGGPSTEPITQRDQSWNDFAGRPTTGPTTDSVNNDRNSSLDQTNTRTATQPVAGVGSTDRTSVDTFGQPPRGFTFPSRGNAIDDRSAIDPFKGSIGANDRFNQDPSANGRVATESSSEPDRRLTAGELAAGAWSIDRYGQLLDRNGRLISVTDPRDSEIDPRVAADRRFDPRRSPVTLEQPQLGRTGIDTRFARETGPFQQGPYQQGPIQQGGAFEQTYQPVSPSSNRSDVAVARADRNPISREASLREQSPDPRSLSDQERSDADSVGRDQMRNTARNHVASQPFFNGLLLISFVANIYLMFWLKNLRLRFRDLVVAKRLSNANTQPS